MQPKNKRKLSDKSKQKKEQREKQKEAEKKAQREFEEDVKKMKAEADKLNVISTSSHFNYGKDPQKPGCNLGKRKSLPRICSRFIRNYISKWIPNGCKLNYCTISKGRDRCCYNLQQYTFGEPLKLVSLIQERYQLNSLQMNDQLFLSNAAMKTIIDEKTTNCKLEVVVNEYVSIFYLKRIKQDRLAKSMDIAQNHYRMSYAPEIYVEISDNILMRLRCNGSCVGVGFWDLVKRTVKFDENVNGINAFEDDVHSMIHICDSFDIMSKVDITFGVKNINIDSICIKVNGEHLKEYNYNLILYEYKTEQMNSNNSVTRYQMPTIGNLSSVTSVDENTNNNNSYNKKRSIEQSSSTAKPSKKRRIK